MPHKKITQLKDTIRATHGCESLHVESVPVEEIFEWSYRDGDQTKSIAVLEVPPVESPQSAVKVAIAVLVGFANAYQPPISTCFGG
jgi:hypothetical protein